MAFHELIKNFDRLREYMRSFYVYGYKTRSDFAAKSSRTYDNERRRAEAYLGNFLRWEYGKGGKRMFLSAQSSAIPQNPFFQLYRSKSFTDNDILLHFFLLELLESRSPMTASQLTDALAEEYGEVFDAQTVRGKLREYAGAGLLTAKREGRNLLYAKSALDIRSLFENQEDWEQLRDFLAFFEETAPFGVVGSYLLEKLTDASGPPQAPVNPHLRFKHHFLAHPLEDNILLPIVLAMEQGELVELKNFSSKKRRASAGPQEVSTSSGVPVAILSSSQTGRRYLMLYAQKQKRFLSFRLDCIQSVRRIPVSPQEKENAAQQKSRGLDSLETSWGASLSWRQQTERFSMELMIDEHREQYVLERLKREGRGGKVERIGPNAFLYTVEVGDSNELLPWVKTFTGRILRVEGDNRQVVRKFYSDMERMAQLYRPCPEEEK